MPDQIQGRAKGKWLWGGVLFDHFGHFLIESLSRLWALDRTTGLRGVIFIPRRPRRGSQLLGFQRAVLQCLDVDLQFRIVRRNAVVDELVVPGQGLGLGPPDVEGVNLACGTPETRQYFKNHFATEIEPDGPDMLYVSRARLELATGGLAGEDQLEILMAEQGYEIFHPETVDIATQIARYKAARKIVFSDGSAAHLFALVARPDQSIAYIRRRSYWSEGPIDHITGFSGRHPIAIDALSGQWEPLPNSQYKRTSIGQLDLPILGRQLEAAGFVDDGSNWPELDVVKLSKLMNQQGLTDAFAFNPT